MSTETALSTTGADTDHAAASAWVAGFADGWRAPAGPDAFLAHFREMLAADLRLIQPQVPVVVGLDAFEHEFVRPLFALVPDIHADVERWATDGETIYIELTLRGTIGRRPFSARVCDRVRLNEDGLAGERESYFDPSPMLAAVARSPRAWPLFLSLRVRGLARLLKRSER